MKNIMITAAAAALLMPLGASAGDKDKIQTEVKAETAAPYQTKIQAAAQTTGIRYLEPGQISAKEILGEGVIGANGDRIARVDDLVIGADGKAQSVVFLSGGLFGLGGKRGALDYDRVNLTVDAEHDPRVKVSMTEEAIQSVAEYKTEKMNDYSLASELIGATAKLMNTDKDAVISDLILETDGSVRLAVVQEGMFVGFGEKHAVNFDKIAVEQGDGGVVIDLTPDALKASQRFEYRNVMSYDDQETTIDVDVDKKTTQQ